MELEYFQIREDDREILEQLVGMGSSLHSFLDYYETLMFARHNRIYACIEGSDLVGCCYYVRSFDDPSLAFLYGINMVKKSRSVSKELLEISFKDLKASGVSTVEAFIEPENAQSIRSYKDNHGFEIYTPTDDEPVIDNYVTMRKTL